MWLLESLRDSDRHTISTPVHRLLSEFKDEECLEAVLDVIGKDIWYYHKVKFQNLIIANFPLLPAARSWAEKAFSEIDGPSLASVAKGYQQDPIFRNRLLRAVRPAKSDVRAQVFSVLREYSIPQDSGLLLTEEILAEEKSEIRSAGIVARCTLAARNSELRDSFVTTLREELKSQGTYYERRRRAAFAGLLQLHEYTFCAKAISEEPSRSPHWLFDYHSIDVIVSRIFFEHWDRLREGLATESRTLEIPWGALIYNGSAREAIFDATARAQLISYLKAMEVKDRSAGSLSLMAELLPKSSELRSCLIECIANPLGYRNLSFEAMKIYAEQYGGDDQSLLDIQKYMDRSDKSPLSSGMRPILIYALALGWPQSPLLLPYLEQPEIPRDFPLLTTMALCGVNCNETQILACIDRLIQLTSQDGRALPDIYWETLLRWARANCAEPLLRRLKDDPIPSRKINALELLDATGKLTNEDRIDLARQFDESLDDTAKGCPDGFALKNGMVATLPQAFYRLLMSIQSAL